MLRTLDVTKKRLGRSTGSALALCLLVFAGCGSNDAISPAAPAADFVDAAPIAAAAEVGKIRYGDDPTQFGWLSIPQSPAPEDGYPIVILVHGGFWSEPWDYTLMSPLATDLADRGLATWNIEFRRVGGRGGWPTTFEDVSAAIDHVTALAADHPLDLDRSVLIGHSSGGHLALWGLDRAWAGHQPTAAIGLGAVVDLEAFSQAQALLGGTRDQVPDLYDAATPALDPARVALVHGEDDRIVPATTLAAAVSNGVPITLVPNADHFAVIDPASDAWAATIAVIEGFVSGDGVPAQPE